PNIGALYVLPQPMPGQKKGYSRKAETSPLPSRMMRMSSWLRSITDVGSTPQAPPSSTTSTWPLTRSAISSGSDNGTDSPGSSSVELMSGSPSSSSRA